MEWRQDRRIQAGYGKRSRARWDRGARCEVRWANDMPNAIDGTVRDGARWLQVHRESAAAFLADGRERQARDRQTGDRGGGTRRLRRKGKGREGKAGRDPVPSRPF